MWLKHSSTFGFFHKQWQKWKQHFLTLFFNQMKHQPNGKSYFWSHFGKKRKDECVCVCGCMCIIPVAQSHLRQVCCFWHTSKTHWYEDETSVLYQHHFSYQYAALFNQSKMLKFAKYKIFYTFFIILLKLSTKILCWTLLQRPEKSVSFQCGPFSKAWRPNFWGVPMASGHPRFGDGQSTYVLLTEATEKQICEPKTQCHLTIFSIRMMLSSLHPPFKPCTEHRQWFRSVYCFLSFTFLCWHLQAKPVTFGAMILTNRSVRQDLDAWWPISFHWLIISSCKQEMQYMLFDSNILKLHKHIYWCHIYFSLHCPLQFTLPG